MSWLGVDSSSQTTEHNRKHNRNSLKNLKKLRLQWKEIEETACKTTLQTEPWFKKYV